MTLTVNETFNGFIAGWYIYIDRCHDIRCYIVWYCDIAMVVYPLSICSQSTNGHSYNVLVILR